MASSDYSDEEFEWSLEKDSENLAKHGVSFGLAQCVFNDTAHYTGDGYIEMENCDTTRYDASGSILYCV